MTIEERARKKRRVSWIAFLALVGLPALCLRLPAAGQGVEDCVAAVVNGKAVTLVDVRIALRFGLHAGDPREVSRSAVLDRLVEQKLVLDLARGTAAPGDEEIAAAADEAARRMGPGEWAKALQEFGLEARDLRPFLEETAHYRRTIAARFSQASPVTIKEIESYYNDVYVPAEKRAGAEPVPMVQVLDRIESFIQERKREKLVADWIGNLKAQADIRVHRDCLE
jgi:hypothetical protein